MKARMQKVCLDVCLTRFRGAEWGRGEASISHAGFPGETAASAPDTANPWPSLHTTLLCQEGLAAGGSVNKHIVEQHTGEAPEHIHGSGKEKMRTECNNKGQKIYTLDRSIIVVYDLIQFFRRGKITLQKV